MAGDAVPRTPEPDRKRFLDDWRKSHIVELTDPGFSSSAMCCFATAYAASVTAHKDQEIVQLEERIEFLDGQRVLFNETLAERDQEIAALRAEVGELRFGIERVIEKTRYDEYGTFEDIRNRIIALCNEVLAESANQP